MREISVVATAYQFVPAVILVQPGEQIIITVTNGGMIFHTFTFNMGAQEIHLPLNPGETKSTEVLTFVEPQQVLFWCRPHQYAPMTGTIEVSSDGASPTSPATESESGGDPDYDY